MAARLDCTKYNDRSKCKLAEDGHSVEKRVCPNLSVRFSPTIDFGKNGHKEQEQRQTQKQEKMPRKKKWNGSIAKRLLFMDLRSGAIPLHSDEMSPMDVYLQRVEFTDFPYERFRNNLRSLRNWFLETNARSEEDAAALARDFTIRPIAARNTVNITN